MAAGSWWWRAIDAVVSRRPVQVRVQVRVQGEVEVHENVSEGAVTYPSGIVSLAGGGVVGPVYAIL